MEYVLLGRTGLRVSRIGFGGAPAGLTNYLGAYDPADAQQRRRVIDAAAHAAEGGINYFDTAPAYGGGASEQIIGEALAGAGESVIIATKVGGTDDEVRCSVEQSLRRLRRQRIDVVQLHGDSWSDERAEALLREGGVVEQLEQLRSEGLIRFIGFTSEDTNCAVWRFIRCGRFDVMQIAYNLIFQHPAEPTRPFGSMYEAERHQMGIVTMRSATSGILQKWISLVNAANRFDYTPSLIQFVLSNPLVDVALVGMRSADEVDANLRIEADKAGRIDIRALHERYVR